MDLKVFLFWTNHSACISDDRINGFVWPSIVCLEQSHGEGGVGTISGTKQRPFQPTKINDNKPINTILASHNPQYKVDNLKKIKRTYENNILNPTHSYDTHFYLRMQECRFDWICISL